ncbi:MAG: TatD family deoxyribonuclease [Cenarchaeum sp. SB0664_bin_35]|nr:TatD family deoxyribonuclease [Cenarchaeum sp. SB0664_bin_35]
MKPTIPIYDAHIHLSDAYYSSHMEYILRAMNATNTFACCVSTNLEDSVETLRLSRASAHVLPFVGIHPQFANMQHITHLKSIMYNEVIAGVGEVGLDPTYPIDMKTQKEVFTTQMDMAENMNLPVSIHSRKSLDTILDTLTSYSCRVLLHWFDGGKSGLRRAMDMGLYVSYGPLTVYASDKRRLLSLTHSDRLLVETDGPVSFSGCFCRLPAQLEFLYSVAFVAAKERNLSDADTLELLYSNVKSYLGIRR